MALITATPHRPFSAQLQKILLLDAADRNDRNLYRLADGTYRLRINVSRPACLELDRNAAPRPDNPRHGVLRGALLPHYAQIRR